ncbi:MAG: hypothetical protein WDO16_09760 [Bacteroidota bacterium]
MKKVFAILAVSAVFAACNNESTAEAETKRIEDSTHAADSVAKVAAEAKAAIDSIANAAKDTINAKVDTAKSKM